MVNIYNNPIFESEIELYDSQKIQAKIESKSLAFVNRLRTKVAAKVKTKSK